MDATETLRANLDRVRQRITAAEARFGRRVGSVQLLAVSKGVAADKVRDAWAAGQCCFGENYLQEALAKMADPTLDGAGMEWHFIGPLQANKTKKIAAHFAWVQSVDRLVIAQRLSEQRPPHLPPLNICLQVNISAESSKSGVGLEQLRNLAEQVAALPHLRLRGLMCIPKPATDFAQQRAPFRALREALEKLHAAGLPLDTLSMGMSDDLEAAIAEGATMVRIGRAVFGERSSKVRSEAYGYAGEE
ncbi:MAG: YggS family pyridoxal phosphate-dependent enzyme [Pseudomonadota bacterium]